MPTLVPTSSPQINRSPIAVGRDHSCVLTEAGGVKCWGANGSGELGNGTTTDSSTPVAVSGLKSGVKAVTAGDRHTCALTSAGGVKCWGSNYLQAIVNGPPTSILAPVDVDGLGRGVTAIAAGGAHTCALTLGGAVKCWGSNWAGQLGNGAATYQVVAAPLAVSGLGGGVAAIAAGGSHTCALMADGRVKCWGANDLGELGNGTTSTSSIPVEVAGITGGSTGIAVGVIHTCAITSAGGVMCWGSNYLGELGIGTTTNSHVPVNVPGLAGGVAAIGAGNSHSCALMNDGGVKCWGANRSGQLGTGTTANSNVPADVLGLASGVTAIAVGDEDSCAFLDTGAVQCWGRGFLGQLGRGTQCDSSVPVDVPLDADQVPAAPSIEPTSAPTGSIEHPTGPTDVVLRFDVWPDLAVSELGGESFHPGPEFTLYGDGTVIFRNDLAPLPPAEGAIVRASGFNVAHLDEGQIQSLLSFALGEGGLADACEHYDPRYVDADGGATFSVRAGGLDKQIEDLGGSPLDPLAAYLRNFDGGGGLQMRGWKPDRYRGNLLDAGWAIEAGVLPDPLEAGIAPWPWPSIAPEEFVMPANLFFGRRLMSADEASVLGLSDNGGVVQRVYLRAPDGVTIYSFSLWPVFPDETS